MRIIFSVALAAFSICMLSCSKKINFYKADDVKFAYMGRIDFTEKSKPKMWASAAQVSFVFKGTSCKVVITDEQLYNTFRNYINVIVDGNYRRIKLQEKTTTITIAEDLEAGTHHVIICKSTEAGVGFIQFEGVYCEELLDHPAIATRKIESYGDSITSAMSSDNSEVACGQGDWYDQTNAWFSYAAITARSLGAQYHLTSASGIGLIHSCCDMDILMPQVYDKISLRDNKIQWDFSKYQPDVVTICLGQNDGVQDSTTFCSAYVKFINTLRTHYPKATVVCLSSPMADAILFAAQKKYLTGVKNYFESNGEKNVFTYFFSKKFISGCSYHPSVNEQKEIAAELTACIKKIKNW